MKKTKTNCEKHNFMHINKKNTFREINIFLSIFVFIIFFYLRRVVK